MSETLQRSGAAFLSRFGGLRGRLQGDCAARDLAAASFTRLGLPGRRNEDWKYTDLRTFGEIEFAEPMLPAGDRPQIMDRVPALESPLLVYVDGRYRADLSSLREGGYFSAQGDLGRLARPDRDSFVALNTMLTEDGARVVIPSGVDAGVLQIVSLATDVHRRPVAFHPRHHIELATGARLTLVEIALGEGTYLHNPVSEIIVGAGASLAHVRLQEESTSAFHIATLYAEIGTRGVYHSFLLALGGRLARSEVHACLTGDGATVHLNCAQLLRGSQHGDFTTVISHEAPAGKSRQTVRNVLDDAARGVFQGRINVARAAQKTDGYQMNHALLLSPQSEIDSKPELRINADDVKCSHGATVGELDADQLFYLRSRGVPLHAARAMLVRGFLSESLGDVANGAVRAVLEDAVERWWDRQAA